MRLPTLLSQCAIVCLSAGCASAAVSLFNGENLDNWKVVYGSATYKVEDGAIVGTTAYNTPNSFLAYDKKYGDFILEFEFFVDPVLNSGVQFRSQTPGGKPTGRVYGYQFEFDPSDRAWSAGIYDEGRKGWLYSNVENPNAQKAFKNNEWNKARIEAVGNSIRTWLNGVPVANLITDLSDSGLIALQVHSIYRDEQFGKQVRWRNITIEEDVAKYATPDKGEVAPVYYMDNKLTQLDQRGGFTMLWDGETTNGWRSMKNDKFPTKGWTIENGQLIVQPSGGGNIITVKKYKNFDFKVDFKITEGANSGIKYFIDLDKGATTGCEFQILDNEKHRDSNQGKDGNHKMGSLYDLIPAPADLTYKKNDFNTARILVEGNHVEHWLNGKKVLEYERNTPEWDTLVKGSKYHDKPNFGNATEGHILLQDHGNKVIFKNIKIKEL